MKSSSLSLDFVSELYEQDTSGAQQ
jgi:hypothetical protein